MAKRRRGGRVKGLSKGKSGVSIYRGRRTHPLKTLFKIVGILIILAAIVFLAYSIGKPIIDYINSPAEERGDPWTKPKPVVTQESTEPVTEQTEAQTTSAVQQMMAGRFSAVTLSADDIASTESLAEAASGAKNQGYSAAVLCLKTEGGRIYYATGSEMGILAGDNVMSAVTAQELVSTVKAAGLIPIAQINLLNDNNMYGRKGVYKYENEDSVWLDNSPTKGGKPWLSPFSADTQTYFAQISRELSDAGFELIICDGLIFPPFRNSDLNYVGSIVKNEERWQALTGCVDTVRTNTDEKVAVAAKMKASGIIDGTAEAFKPEALAGSVIAVEYADSEIGNAVRYGSTEIVVSDMTAGQKAAVIFTAVGELAPGVEILPCIDTAGLSTAEVGEIVSELVNLGYSNYIIE